MNSKEARFCPVVLKSILLKEGFAKCSNAHQCFDDSPCPLYVDFELLKRNKKRKVISLKKLNRSS